MGLNSLLMRMEPNYWVIPIQIGQVMLMHGVLHLNMYLQSRPFST